jgi:hypothetical protein
MINLLYSIVIFVVLCVVFVTLFYLFAKLTDKHPNIALGIIGMPVIVGTIYLIWLTLENGGW